jgi:hypothetical protein
MRSGTSEPLITLTEDVAQIPGASGNQVTVQKILRLNGFSPGKYTLRLDITDSTCN